MQKIKTVAELRKMLESAPVARSIENIGKTFRDIFEYDEDGCSSERTVFYDNYRLVQTVQIECLEFYTQAALSVPIDASDGMIIDTDPGWAWIVVDKCDFEFVDWEGDEIDEIGAIYLATECDRAEMQRLPVAEYEASDWTGILN